MQNLNDYVRSADWKTEKHVPAITLPETVRAGEWFDARVAVGQEIPHPNTTGHHIAWIALHFIPKDGKYSIVIGRQEFGAHGQDAGGPDQGPAHTDSAAVFRMKTAVPGTLAATAYCNIHGLWTCARGVDVE